MEYKESILYNNGIEDDGKIPRATTGSTVVVLLPLILREVSRSRELYYGEHEIVDTVMLSQPFPMTEESPPIGIRVLRGACAECHEILHFVQNDTLFISMGQCKQYSAPRNKQ